MARRFGEYLIQEGLLSETQLAHALERQITVGGRLGTNLVELGFLSDLELTRALSQHLKMAPADPDVFDDIPDDVVRRLPRELVQRHGAVPFRREGRTLCVAMADPSELVALDELTFAAGCSVRPYLASDAKVQSAMEKYYGLSRPLRYITVMPGNNGDGAMNLDDLEALEQTLPTIENFAHALRLSHDELLHVKHRDEIVGLLLREFSRVADHALFFAVVDERFIGIMGRGAGYASDIFVGMELRLEESPLLRQAVEKREPVIQMFAPEVLGPALAELLNSYQPRQIAAFPLEASGRVIGVIYTDKQQADGTFPYVDLLQKLLIKGGMAIDILILKKKIQEL